MGGNGSPGTRVSKGRREGLSQDGQLSHIMQFFYPKKYSFKNIFTGFVPGGISDVVSVSVWDIMVPVEGKRLRLVYIGNK